MRFLLVSSSAQNGTIESIGPHLVRNFNPRLFLHSHVYSTYPTADLLVSLHKHGDPSMKSMLAGFLKAIRDFGAEGLVAHQNAFPPEWLFENTQGLVRVLGCFDDPQKTYSATLPVVWAYHGAYFCSPSYSKTRRFADALRMFGVPHSHWFPLSQTKPTDALVAEVEASWSRRVPQAVYIGKCYGDKVDKLAQFDRGIGGRLRLYGQGWPLAGLGGFLAPLRGRTMLPKWVRPIDERARRTAYLSSLVGMNTHLGDGEETGNMRMYETPMHGAMLLCDMAGCNAHADIFEPDVEAVYYSSIEEAVDKCLHYFGHPEQALAIARRGFARARLEYNPQKVLLELLNWAAAIPLHEATTDARHGG